MWVDFFGQALVPRFTAAVADAVARASWNGLLEVAPERRRRPVRRLYLLASPTLALSTVKYRDG